MSLSFEKERAINSGDKQVGGFTGAVRSLDNFGLEEGDTFTLPTVYEVFEQKLGGNRVQYIFIELTNGKVKKFYPSTFTKSRTIYNEDGTPTNQRFSTKGSAAELFRSHTSIPAAMDALKGKTLKVTKIETVRTLRYGSIALMDAQIPTIDIVDAD